MARVNTTLRAGTLSYDGVNNWDRFKAWACVVSGLAIGRPRATSHQRDCEAEHSGHELGRSTWHGASGWEGLCRPNQRAGRAGVIIPIPTRLGGVPIYLQ